LVDKMDLDNDGFISEDEMRIWLKGVASKYVDQDVSRTFDEYRNEFKTDYVTFEQHKNKISDDYEEEDDSDDGELQQTLARDQRRFEKADANGDGKLTKEEFAAFLHPEEFDHMRDIVISETLEDLDSNKDGRIDLEEYTRDMWVDDSQSPPEWVKTEQQQFKEARDKNKDGYLDREEIYAWLFPSDYDHIESELKHLMSETDDDQDGKLSKDEILSHYHVFVGSQATDFGQALYSHDEL
uniref:Reticulocalbin-3 n=1 Tax=Taenia asiatica TaxID=60517 RepID=A0A0R3WAE9_TAEAS